VAAINAPASAEWRIVEGIKIVEEGTKDVDQGCGFDAACHFVP